MHSFQACVSAKHSGMRFGSWREPKPLRPRCNSANVLEAAETPDLPSQQSPRRSAGRAPIPVSARGERATPKTYHMRDQTSNTTRLSQPTASSTWKTSKARAREALVDMNYYSWSKMNVYKDYVGVIYGSNGTAKRTK